MLVNYNFRTLPAHWSASHTTYWQHGDHLGSASWVTDTNGTACQHLQYMPWGEPLVDLRSSSSSYDTRYTFSGKERDEETGYSYFGARYYNSALSIWLSVDPMSDKYPGVSPYAYCANNPVKLVDPNVREIYIDGYLYTPGQACPEKASESTRNKWESMDLIYSRENGECVIDEMVQSKSCYSISSETKSNSLGCYSSNQDGTGGTIYLNGHDKNVATLAHELFHGYQDMNGRDNHSIFNEIEANLFSFSITGSIRGTGLFIDSPKNQAEKNFNDNMMNLLFSPSLNNDSFEYIINNFTEYSPMNWRGTYDNYSNDTFSTSLISDFYPLFPVR